MPFSYHGGHGHLEQCHRCVYSYGRWFEPCEENYVRNGCCLCTPQCPDGMPMAVWPHSELNDYVCLVPAHEHDDESLKEIEIEKQVPWLDYQTTGDKTEVKPVKKEKEEGESRHLEPKKPDSKQKPDQ